MPERFFADPEQLRRQAPEFDRIADGVSGTVQELEAALAAAGAPWGDDDAGTAFARSYIPEKEQALSDLNTLVQVLQQSGRDLEQLADNLSHMDDMGRQQIANSDPASPRTSATPLPVHVGPGYPSDPFTPTTTPAAQPAPTEPPATTPPPVSSPATVPETADEAPHVPTGTPGDGQADSFPAHDQQQGQPADGSPRNNPPDSTRDSAPSPSGPPTQQASTNRTAPPQPSAATARPAASAATPRPLPSPWSSPASPTSPWGARPTATGPTGPAARPPRISAPTQGTPGAAPPRIPPRPTQPQSQPTQPQKAEKPDRKPSAPRLAAPLAESLAARLTRELAERHRIWAFGFDTGGVPDETLMELVAAVDTILPRHPQIDLRAIGIGELPDGELTRLEWETEPAAAPGKPSNGAAQPPAGNPPHHLFTARIVLAAHAATNPDYLEETLAAAESSRQLAARSARRPVYSSIVRELGAALDVAGAFRAHRSAHRALLLEYLPLHPPSQDSLQGIVTGFRRWRAQLPGRSFRQGRFDPAGALSEAFTEVVLNASQATPAARALHRLLVHTAEANVPTTSQPAKAPYSPRNLR